MIPNYPNFKMLEITDKPEIDEYVSKFPPYADYNFVSLWTWNTTEKAEVSFLHGNLVIKFIDYLTSDLFYSFLGTNNVSDTIAELLVRSRHEKLQSALKLIPEINILEKLHDISEMFHIQPDNANVDYVLSIDDLAEMKGSRFLNKRNYVNRFTRENPDVEKRILDLGDLDIQKQIEHLFMLWSETGKKDPFEIQNELSAIKRVYALQDEADLQTIGLYKQGNMIGFSIDEVIHDHYSISHYEKGDIQYHGVYEYLKQKTAIHLKELGCSYFNVECDLGLDGLRQAKLGYNPILFLNKYTISEKVTHP